MAETKFKHTEIGRIPEDWEVKIIGEHASIYRGGSPRPIEDYLTHSPNGINWLKIGDVSPTDKYFTRCAEKIIPEGVSRSRVVHAGDFILSNSMSFGRPYILKIDGCIHDGWLVIQDYAKTFDMDYLYYILSSEYVHKQYVSSAAGSSVKNLNKEKVACVIVATPPTLAEQKRIAGALSSIDSLIYNLDRTIGKKQNIKLGAMQELLSSQKRLKGFAEEWKEMSLEEMGFLTAGSTPSTMNPEYWGGDINWLQSGAVQNCLIMPDAVEKKITRAGLQNSSAYLIRPNSVLIAITGATCANVGFLTFESAANQSVVSIEPYEDYDAMFLYQKLLTEKTNILSNKGGSAQSGVTLKALKQLTILVPPTIQEQRAIADLLTAMDDEIAVLQMERDKYANIRSGMMDDLLTGTKRL